MITKLPDKKLDIKMVAADLDDTLLNSKSVLSPGTIATLRRVVDKGIQLVLCSGRSDAAMLPFIRVLNIAGHQEGRFIVSFNGAEVFDLHKRMAIYRATVDKDILQYAYHVARDYGVPCVVYKNSVMYSYIDNEWSRLDSKLCNIAFDVVKDFDTFLESGFPKMLLPGDPKKIEELTPILRENLKGKADIYISKPYFLEVMAHNVGKGQTLTKLCDLLHIDAKKMLTFGDSMNDESMLKNGGAGGFCGTGVAMCNGVAQMQECATYVTKYDNDNDGVARFLEDYVL